MTAQPSPTGAVTVCLRSFLIPFCLLACRVDGDYVLPDAPPQAKNWISSFGGSGMTRSGIGRSIAVAPNGDLVLVGSFSGRTMLGGTPIVSKDSFSPDIWAARYHSDGSYLWSVGLGGIFDDEAIGVTVDPDGDVYLVGYTLGAQDFTDGVPVNPGALTVKLAGSTGQHLWHKSFGTGMQDSGTRALGVALIDLNTIVVSGVFRGSISEGPGCCSSQPVSGTDCLLIAYDSSTGARVWTRQLPSTGDEFPARCNVIGLNNGDIIATGGFAGTMTLGTQILSASGQDIFVARFRGTDGTPMWAKAYGGPGDDNSYAISTYGAHVFVGGRFNGVSNFGSGELVSMSSDAFVVAYNVEDGSPLWSQRFGGIGDDEVTSIASTPGQLTVSLAFEASVQIGEQSFTMSPPIDANDLLPGKDILIERLDPLTGVPARGWHFTNTESTMALEYSGNLLVGNGIFGLTTSAFGTPLSAKGLRDVIAFRVNLDQPTL